MPEVGGLIPPARWMADYRPARVGEGHLGSWSSDLYNPGGSGLYPTTLVSLIKSSGS